MVAGSTSSTPPPLPPTTEADRISWLRLLRSPRIGPENFFRLLEKHGTANEALAALPELAIERGVKLYQTCSDAAAEKELRTGQKLGAILLAAGDPDYPQALYDLRNPPPLLWVKGRVDVLQRPSLAIVGSRNASALGLRLARSLAKNLSEAGYVITSGLARGIDAAAHDSALRHGTIAVLGGAVDRVYPKENMALALSLQSNGALISEAPLGTTAMAKLFPPRNRIIAALAKAVIVVEAAVRSGTFITAKDALDIGRDVMAVPGHPFDGHAAGCNALIRDGAVLVRNANDVLEALPAFFGHQTAPVLQKTTTPKPSATALQSRLLTKLGTAPISEDDLIRVLNVPSAELLPLLAELELQGEVIRSRGGMISAATTP